MDERLEAQMRAELDQQLSQWRLKVVNTNSAYSIADLKGNVVERGTEFSPTMTLQSVKLWIAKHQTLHARHQQQ
jgi:hypothetical protein